MVRTATTNRLKTEILTLTPEQAHEILTTKNTHNRPLNPNTVETYSRIINEGRWRLTHQGIAFDENGALLDGQHRLAAIVKSKKTVKVMVTHNLPPEDFASIDTGRRRTPADALGIAGIESNRNQIASIANFLNAYDREDNTGWNANHASRLDNERLIETVDQYGAERINAAIKMCVSHAKTAKINITVLSSFYYLAHYRHMISADDLMDFIEGIGSGAGLGANDPRLMLRNSTLRAKAGMKRDRMRREQLIAVIKSWNAFREGRKVGRLTIRDGEPIPRIVTAESVIRRH